MLSDDLLAVFDSLPVYFIMKKGGINCYPASRFTHHAVIFKRESLFYGVRIQTTLNMNDMNAIDLYNYLFLL